MNKPSKYTQQLLQFLESEENYPAMLEWIDELPELDQPDIFREMQAFYKEQYLKTGEQDWLDKSNTIAKGVDNFEEVILDIKLDNALLNMQLDNTDLITEQIELLLIQSRKTVIKNILSYPESKIEMMKDVQRIIELEKESGVYDPANWSEIL